MSERSIQLRLSLVFFLLAAMPGCWTPVLSIVLEARGWSNLTDWVFVIPSLGAVVSPLLLAAVADQRVNAEKVLAAVMTANAICTASAFWFLGQGNSQAWFLFFLVAKALLGAPAWSLLMSITLTHLTEPERQFGGVRVWGTIGWMMAGWGISWFALDESPMTGIVASCIGVIAAGFSLTLPATPPSGIQGKTLAESLGLKAFSILKDRDTAVYFLTAFLFSIPLAAYYVYTPKFLKYLEVENVAMMLSLGQTSEIISMLLMGWVFRRLRVKWIFLLALGAGLLRYAFYFGGVLSEGALPGWGQVVWVAIGIFMHGFCWTLFFESGRLFVDRRVPREVRSQAQALMTVSTGGVATIVGVFFSGWLYRWCVEGDGPGWMGFWAVLVGLCVFSLLVFAIGYKGLPVAVARSSK
ncbi:MFS transporter [Roseibacillus persicicus]|uniref:MFS transporter n=1 Tax=Roseibacillus persicicus TaxID=454148 RepID=UPI00280EEF2C|nr:MFS transporter [Roseibacillus persicicus]MDQ8191951.1 MFS transporter [Roseibacillus persicicus]